MQLLVLIVLLTISIANCQFFSILSHSLYVDWALKDHINDRIIVAGYFEQNLDKRTRNIGAIYRNGSIDPLGGGLEYIGFVALDEKANIVVADPSKPKTFLWNGTNWNQIGANNQIYFASSIIIQPKTNRMYFSFPSNLSVSFYDEIDDKFVWLFSPSNATISIDFFGFAHTGLIFLVSHTTLVLFNESNSTLSQVEIPFFPTGVQLDSRSGDLMMGYPYGLFKMNWSNDFGYSSSNWTQLVNDRREFSKPMIIDKLNGRIFYGYSTICASFWVWDPYSMQTQRISMPFSTCQSINCLDFDYSSHTLLISGTFGLLSMPLDKISLNSTEISVMNTFKSTLVPSLEYVLDNPCCK